MEDELNKLARDLNAAHQQFIGVAQQLETTLQTKPGVCGDWSPKDVIAHLLGWDNSLLTFIIDLENFVPPTDVEQFNQASVAANKTLGWNELMIEFTSNFALLAKALAAVEPAMKIYRRVTSWSAGRIADYQLHHNQLANWLP